MYEETAMLERATTTTHTTTTTTTVTNERRVKSDDVERKYTQLLIQKDEEIFRLKAAVDGLNQQLITSESGRSEAVAKLKAASSVKRRDTQLGVANSLMDQATHDRDFDVRFLSYELQKARREIETLPTKLKAEVAEDARNQELKLLYTHNQVRP